MLFPLKIDFAMGFPWHWFHAQRQKPKKQSVVWVITFQVFSACHCHSDTESSPVHPIWTMRSRKRWTWHCQKLNFQYLKGDQLLRMVEVFAYFILFHLFPCISKFCTNTYWVAALTDFICTIFLPVSGRQYSRTFVWRNDAWAWSPELFARDFSGEMMITNQICGYPIFRYTHC